MNTEIEKALAHTWNAANPDPVHDDTMGTVWDHLGEATREHLTDVVKRTIDMLDENNRPAEPDPWEYLGGDGLVAYERLQIGDYVKAVRDAATTEYRTPLVRKLLNGDIATLYFADGDSALQLNLNTNKIYTRPEPVTPPVPDDHKIIIDTNTGNPWFADTEVYISPFMEDPRYPSDFGNNWEPAEIKTKPRNP